VTRRVVCDASALIALLLDGGDAGRRVADELDGAQLLAPTLVDFEAANIFRRLQLAREVSADQAAQAHADLLDLDVERWPYELLAPRAWSLRENLTIYDASYVALGELTGATLLTLDGRLARAPGIRCSVTVAGA